MGTLATPADLLDQIAGLLAPVVALQEALEDGDLAYAAAIAEQLELDLVGLRDRLERTQEAPAA